MTPDELARWQTRQIAAAIAIGIHPLDAQKAMDEVMATLPPGADPRTYMRSARELEQDVSSAVILADARAAWFAEADPRYARILDAKEVGE
jgi:hypothetical protein